jgi:hypothetical protein
LVGFVSLVVLVGLVGLVGLVAHFGLVGWVLCICFIHQLGVVLGNDFPQASIFVFTLHFVICHLG